MVRYPSCRPVIGSLAVNALRERLEAPHPLVGTVVTLPDPSLAELTAGAVDFVWIDLEHGALSARDVQPLAIAARAAGAASLVRLPAFDDLALGPALDAGVDGVVAPRVERAEQAERVANRLRYPPAGSRGFAARRASAYGAGGGAAPQPVCMVQVESLAGVENAETIASVDGVDAVVVGSADLALHLGDDPGEPSARMSKAIAAVQRACAAAGTASGVAGPDDPCRLAALAGGRSSVLVLGADVRIYARALRGAVERLHDQPAPSAPEPEEAHVGT